MREGYQKTLIGDIPNDWKLKRLKEVADFSNGKGHEQSIDENGKYIVVNSKFISTDSRVKKFSNENLCPLNKGDITIVMSDIPNGKAIAKCFIVDEDEKYTLNQRIGSLTTKEGVDTKFLYFVLNRNRYYLAFDNGVGQTNLRKDEVTDCPIQFPRLPEQQKIAEILSTVDTKIEIVNQQITETQELKKGLMQQLLTGKLSVVEKRLLNEDEMKDSALGKVPKSWEVEELGTLLKDIKGGGTPSKDVPEYWKDEILWVTVKDLKKLVLDDSIDYISEAGLNNSAANLIPAWTLIISTRMAVGKAVFVTIDVAINQDLKALFPKDNLNKFFLFHWFFANSDNILSLASGSTVKGIRLEVLKGLKLALPSVEEQLEISEILTSFDDKLKVLSEKKATYQELKQGLMQQLLTGKVRVKN